MAGVMDLRLLAKCAFLGTLPTCKVWWPVISGNREYDVHHCGRADVVVVADDLA
jgi:hypothetical protein